MYLEGGWAYTGFCGAVHPAGVSLKFIKSSNVKRVEKKTFTHLTPCVRQRSTHTAERKSVREGEPQLVSQRKRAGSPITWMCVCVCVYSQCFCFRLQVGREQRRMQRTQPAGWRLNGDRAIPQGGGECEITRKVGCDMPLTFYTLCMPVFMNLSLDLSPIWPKTHENHFIYACVCVRIIQI